MPRQDVPYGGAICRLKERIAEIWDKLGEKLHSINGVEGDGAGNVEIVSGDAAITVSESPTGHYIEIGLDHGNLPSAAVSSVNGQTGAAMLYAGNIPSEEHSNVQTDLDANKAAINDCFDSITSEQVARQNADAALQGNINAVQASIPGAAAAAVASDPTVAQLAADVPGKLDKISSGNSLKAYTHTGQSQGETSVVNGIDANSIGLRDANGRMQAADPAAGATDKTLVTANWVSQTGMTRPNNLIHDAGNEDINGAKRHISGVLGQSYQLTIPSNENYSIEIAYKGVTTQFAKIEVFDYINNINSVMWDIFLVWNGGAANKAYGRRLGDPNVATPKFTVDNGILKLIFAVKPYHSYLINVTNARSWSSNQEVTVTTVQNPDYSGLTLSDLVVQ